MSTPAAGDRVTPPRAPERERIPGPAVTDGQIDLLAAIHKAGFLDVRATSQTWYSVGPRALTLPEASALIDGLLWAEDTAARFPEEFGLSHVPGRRRGRRAVAHRGGRR